MQPKTPSVTCMVLTFLTFSSLTLAHPVPSSNKHNVSRAVSSRSPDPRMIPQADAPEDNNNDLISALFDSVGLDEVAKLNHWKSDNEPDTVIDDSNSPQKTVTTENDDVDKEDDKETNNGQATDKDQNKDTEKKADDKTSNNDTTQSNNNKDSDDNQSNKGGKLPNPTTDPSGFVKALMENIQHAFKNAVDSSDEHTLN
ncbi:hypothetical protein AbraIFM66951_003875 [Aspergillus brasiliensis]|uniref:Uncharacterized protein n=1 Tax=Aspergillus brasiliensis TaxID=319629 RepID=A0A9W5YZU0_9EURO|nr:hypothetical protein AbraCBS73388_003801 [Aspergillus brasiliensis]GKZ50613.1 hypothetical protein AbraIFM66951_003875 [Aspergillus brasiliensis]